MAALALCFGQRRVARPSEKRTSKLPVWGTTSCLIIRTVIPFTAECCGLADGRGQDRLVSAVASDPNEQVERAVYLPRNRPVLGSCSEDVKASSPS